MGSVKDLEVIKKPTADRMGIGRFHFSDRYSVFDWGEMPDQFENKGKALCMMGAYCFERLEEKRIKTHYRGLVDSEGETLRFDKTIDPSNVMEVNLVNVYRPKSLIGDGGRLRYNYGIYPGHLTNFLIPLEIIYRNGLPEGSSVFRRLEQHAITLRDLGLNHYPKAGEQLKQPILDVSTKLESKDRYVTWEEAKGMAGLTYGEIVEIQTLLYRIDQLITELAFRAHLKNEDGKIELAFDTERNLMVVDVVGTLDECRFTYDGLHVSKEIARQFYRKTRWFDEVGKAKKEAEEEGADDWRKSCKSQPPGLDSQLKRIISEMYMIVANQITGRRLFDVRSLREIIVEYRQYAQEGTI